MGLYGVKAKSFIWVAKDSTSFKDAVIKVSLTDLPMGMLKKVGKKFKK